MHITSGMIIFFLVVAVIGLIAALNHAHHHPFEWRGPTDKS